MRGSDIKRFLQILFQDIDDCLFVQEIIDSYPGDLYSALEKEIERQRGPNGIKHVTVQEVKEIIKQLFVKYQYYRYYALAKSVRFDLEFSNTHGSS
jgi:hypothetical protein